MNSAINAAQRGRRAGALIGCWFAATASLLAACTNGADRDAEGSGLSVDRLERVGRLAERYVDAGRLPGAVYAVARRGRPAWTGQTGPVETDAIFRIYSMTKPITVVAALMLYEEGRFLLTDPVARYLPEFTDMRIYVGDNDGEPETRPAERPITIEHLLTHTAGLTYDDETVAGVPELYAAADIWSAASLEEFTATVAKLPLVFEPGSAWHYSIANDVLGRLVEVAAGEAFDEFLAARIFAPLGMHDTAFHVADADLDRLPPLYRRDGDGMILAESAADSDYRDADRVPFGGGGLVSTAADYLRFAQMLLNRGELDGERLLAPKTVDLMMLDHLGSGPGAPRLEDAWIGRTENRSGEMDLGLGYGYGGYVVTDVARNAVPGSVGTYAWGGAASTYFFIDPKEQLIGLFLTQLMPSDSYPLRAEFRGLVYQALVD